MDPEAPVFVHTVLPGDSITASVYYDTATDEYQLLVRDAQHSGGSLNRIENRPAGYTCQNDSAEVIAEDPGGGPA